MAEIKEGDRRTQVCKRRLCEQCGEDATWRCTFLLPNARRNPASEAFAHDDCSWCSDGEVFLCDACKQEGRKIGKKMGMEECSSFPYERFPHMLLYWEVEK